VQEKSQKPFQKGLFTGYRLEHTKFSSLQLPSGSKHSTLLEIVREVNSALVHSMQGHQCPQDQPIYPKPSLPVLVQLSPTALSVFDQDLVSLTWMMDPLMHQLAHSCNRQWFKAIVFLNCASLTAVMFTEIYQCVNALSPTILVKNNAEIKPGTTI